MSYRHAYQYEHISDSSQAQLGEAQQQQDVSLHGELDRAQKTINDLTSQLQVAVCHSLRLYEM